MTTNERLLVVKKLRKYTGAGLADCLKALKSCNDDEAEAAKILYEKGLAKNKKREMRSTTEGVACIAIKSNRVCVFALKCETDFVAKNAEFLNLANYIREISLKYDSSKSLLSALVQDNKSNDEAFQKTLEKMSKCINHESVSVEKIIAQFSVLITEKLVLSEFNTFDVSNSNSIGYYVHRPVSIYKHIGPRIALVIFEGKLEETIANKIAMQIVANPPCEIEIHKSNDESNGESSLNSNIKNEQNNENTNTIDNSETNDLNTGETNNNNEKDQMKTFLDMEYVGSETSQSIKDVLEKNKVSIKNYVYISIPID